MKTIIEAHSVSSSMAADHERRYSAPEIWWRVPLMRTFLWISVLTLGIGAGARLFNLIVLAGAWSASPPASLALLPYSSRFPVNPGNFFEVLALPTLVGVLGALISGWNAPFKYRVWLWLPVIMFVSLWVLTITIFWPMNDELSRVASGWIVRSQAELIRLVQRWVTYDWLRVAMLALGFASSVRAISLPVPTREKAQRASLTMCSAHEYAGDFRKW